MTAKEPRTNPKVDAYLGRAKTWREEMQALRAILLSTPLTEELKWGKPCYTVDGHNVLVLAPFKQYCALIVFKGALLKDPRGILLRPTENTQAVRQIRFTGLPEIGKLKTALRGYVADAIAVEKAGLKVTLKKITEHPVPEELQAKLDKLPALKKAFEALTPGRQRAYLLHISGAKQSATRAARVEKWMPQILKGKGMDDE